MEASAHSAGAERTRQAGTGKWNTVAGACCMCCVCVRVRRGRSSSVPVLCSPLRAWAVPCPVWPFVLFGCYPLSGGWQGSRTANSTGREAGTGEGTQEAKGERDTRRQGGRRGVSWRVPRLPRTALFGAVASCPNLPSCRPAVRA
jgi:hypothetical protein